MTIDQPLNHDALLTLARKTQAAAHDGDRERIEASVLHLYEALVDHVGAERLELLHLSPDQGHALMCGQQHVVDLLIELVVAAKTPGSSNCDNLVQQLSAELSLQADDERRAGVST